MPVDPSTYTTWLPSSPHLERIALSSSDRARSERYGASGAVNTPRRECSISSTPPRAGATPASPTRIASPGRGSARSARATAIRGRELMGRTILEPRSDRLYPPPRHPHSRVLHDGYVMGRSAPIGAEPVRAGRWVCAEVDLDASSPTAARSNCRWPLRLARSSVALVGAAVPSVQARAGPCCARPARLLGNIFGQTKQYPRRRRGEREPVGLSWTEAFRRWRSERSDEPGEGVKSGRASNGRAGSALNGGHR
jgi:hypothetical protein